MKNSDDFRIGFITGYRSTCGSDVVVPVIPSAPEIPEGVSAFRLGLDRGIEAGNELSS